jgi:hypothetical protein
MRLIVGLASTIAAPMRVFVRRVKLPLDASVQRSQHANAREHRWPAMFRRPSKRVCIKCLVIAFFGAVSRSSVAIREKRTWRDSPGILLDQPQESGLHLLELNAAMLIAAWLQVSRRAGLTNEIERTVPGAPIDRETEIFTTGRNSPMI